MSFWGKKDNLIVINNKGMAKWLRPEAKLKKKKKKKNNKGTKNRDLFTFMIYSFLQGSLSSFSQKITKLKHLCKYIPVFYSKFTYLFGIL